MTGISFAHLKCVFIFSFCLHRTQFQSCLAATTTTSASTSQEISCAHPQISDYLEELAKTYSHISRIERIGKTIAGRDLLVIIISDQPKVRPLLRPQIKFVGNIMGNNLPSCYILLKLIHHLLINYEVKESLERRLIESNEIHVLPNMNPDGFSKSVVGKCDGGIGKFNSGGVFLNRDFPFIFESPELEIEKDAYRQAETLAVMGWIRENKFLTSVSYFTGAKVVTYPFDSAPTIETHGRRHQTGEPHPTPDDDVFQHLASSYVSNVPDKNWHCSILEKAFPNGRINGAEWKAYSGTMLDFNYAAGTFELCIGISCCRNENNVTNLEQIWLNNKLAMLKIIEESDHALRGQVVDAETNEPIESATLFKTYANFRQNNGRVKPRTWQTNMMGEFWRHVLPGQYLLEVSAEGYKTKTVQLEIQALSPPLPLLIKLHSEKPKLKSKRFNPSPSTYLDNTTMEPTKAETNSTTMMSTTTTMSPYLNDGVFSEERNEYFDYVGHAEKKHEAVAGHDETNQYNLNYNSSATSHSNPNFLLKLILNHLTFTFAFLSLLVLKNS